MPEKTETDLVAENLVKAFVQFRRMSGKDHDKKYNPEHTHHGLKHSEIMVLYELKDVERDYPTGVSVTDISRSLCVKPPSITPIITGLEQKKMIERTIDPNDRRIIRVKMTQAGNIFIEKSKEHMVKQIKGLVEYLGNEKSLTLASLINEVFIYFYNEKKNQNQA